MHTRRTPGLLTAVIAVAVHASSFAADAQKPATGKSATLDERDTLTDRVFAAYLDRFRHWVGEAPDETVDEMVRNELPGILQMDAATVKTFLQKEAQRVSMLDTPIERKLAGLFVLGQYKAVIEMGEKHIAQTGIATLRLMGDAARALFEKEPDKKHYETALRYYQRAAALVDKAKASIIWADIQYSAANVLLNLGRADEAEPLLREVVEIQRREVGEKSPGYAYALNDLAVLLKTTDRFADAEPLYRRALAIGEASLGKEHPDVARFLNNLAQLLKATDRLAEAEPLYRRALAIDEASFGKAHPLVGSDLNNLAGYFTMTQRLAEAEPLLRRALAIAETSFGQGHPKVANRLNNLAGLLQDTDRLDEAERLYRRTCEIFEKSLGPEHPNTRIAKENLELLRKQKGK